ncbi:hypothetical protein P691DRAFT_773945 [Macrolepiota fuliginosa MF-IS2]|uniref:G domain-containing protein n=1 Tax=Macrolepiota fuliginosa MF-IS2 TaxID=1400762 RepID=A0A9P6C371_9AGAR|nr:hypothetical protein P691DRAFT_773945 [Macrolepiota fuliginosa MF-IS2]
MFQTITKKISEVCSKVAGNVWRKHTIDEILIPIIGFKGAGKGTLIEAIAGSYVGGVSHSISEHTMEIRSVPVQLTGTDENKFIVHLIDTPGIDNSERTLDAVLKGLRKWKNDHCENNVNFAGIIFVNSMMNPQPHPDGHLAHRHLSILKELCGQDWENMVLVNTHLDVPNDEQNSIEQVEQRLADGFWKLAMAGPSGGVPRTQKKMQRYDHSDRQKSAWKILWSVIGNSLNSNTFNDKIQAVVDEIGNNGKSLRNIWEAYRELHPTLQAG